LCECEVNAFDEYEENRQECEGKEGDDLNDCEIEKREIYAAALDACTPKEPTLCEQIADAEYEAKKNECMGTLEDCEAEAYAHREAVLKECDCRTKARADFDENMKECEGKEGILADECRREKEAIREKALDQCTPKTPCEEKADAAY